MIRRIWAAMQRGRQGWRLQRTDLFDAGWYLRRYPDLRAPHSGNINPGSADQSGQARATAAFAARHYLANGAAEGRDPGPGFSTSGYALQCTHAGLTLGAENPLLHYLRRGKALGLTALPRFEGAQARPEAAVVLFVAHQAQTHVFGAERSLLHMLDRAGQAGLAAEVLLPQALNPDYLQQLRARSRGVHLLPYGWRQGHQPAEPAAIAAITALIRQTGAIELHQNTTVLDAPLSAARTAGIPSVVYLRELPAQDAELCARLGLSAADLRQCLLAEADRFVANSAAVAQWLEAPERCIVLPNSIDTSLFDLPFQPQTPLRVGLISSNVAKKGLADFLTVAQLCADSLPKPAPFRFVLIGPDSADLAHLSPLPDLVTHAGYSASATAALGQVDIVLSLSGFAESFGRTVYEAMAAGRPVICYDRGTPPDLVGRSSGAGHVVGADDPAAVLAALALFVGDPARLQAASQAARLRANDLRDSISNVDNRQIYAAAFT